MESIPDKFYRINNDTWTYLFNSQSAGNSSGQHVQEVREPAIKEIRINIHNSLQDGSHIYELASSVATIFDRSKEKINHQSLEKGIEIDVVKENVNHPLAGKWIIKAKKVQLSWSEYLKQLVPFLSTITPKNIVEVEVSKINESAWRKISSLFGQTISCAPSVQDPLLFSRKIDSYFSSLSDRIESESFLDPFTALAKDCLTTVEPRFVMETEHKGSWRYILDKHSKTLNLEKLCSCANGDNEKIEDMQEENREVLRSYKKFLEDEYGSWFVKFVALNYGIDLDDMISKGLPLYPDHVSKCNIGMINIEVRHVGLLSEKLKKLEALISSKQKLQKEHIALDTLFEDLVAGKYPGLDFSIRELRGLMRAVNRDILQRHNPEESIASSSRAHLDDLKLFLKKIVKPLHENKIQDTDPAIFNTIVGMIMPTEQERDLSYTGRKIRHLSIMGFHTMGNKNVHNPCRDMFELSHIYSELQKTEDWHNFYELLGHVVVKKSLFRKTPGDKSESHSWHVGLMIPGPTRNDGEQRWYFNDEFVDDGNGNVNYTFLPACNKSKGDYEAHIAPVIKAYRSTASDKNAINWQDSLQADLNPNGSPGSLNPDVSYEYERKLFDQRTIPLWVAYTLAASKLMDDITALQDNSTLTILLKNKVKEYMQKATTSLSTYLDKNYPEDKERYFESVEVALETEDYEQLKKYLSFLAQQYKERPQDKTAQNIAFVGHSLGGALAQFGMQYFGTRVDRIPLPSCHFTCYSSDGPAIDNDKDLAFMNFMKANREVLEILGQKWKIFHQFERGDFVPQAGGSHLGTSGYVDELKSCLDFKARVFKPLPSAQHISITTAPTHGRRIGLAQPGIDYATTPLTPKEVAEFDHSYWLSGPLAEVFGYVFLRSPYATEATRLQAARLLYPVNRLIDALVGNTIGSRDKNGVFYSSYSNAL